MASLTLAPEPPRSYVTPVLIAALVLAAVAAALFYFNPHHTATVVVTRTEVFAPATQLKAYKGSMNVIGAAPATEQDLFLAVTIHLQNEQRFPLFIDEVDAAFTGADDTQQTTVAPARADLLRTETIFPQLKPMLAHPLLLGDEVGPKTAVDGQVLLHFANLDATAWKSRKAASLVIHFAHQPPVTVDMK